MKHPLPYSDTQPEAMKVWIDLLRKKTPGEKLEMVLGMTNGGHAQLHLNMRKRYPAADDREIFRRILTLHLGDEPTFEPVVGLPMSTPAEGFRRLLATFDKLEMQYLVSGSVASSTHGHLRYTRDVDFVVAIGLDDVEELAAELTRAEFYADAGAMRDGIRRSRAFNVIFNPCVYKYDIFPLRDDEFSRRQFARRRFALTGVFDEPIECAMASPEDVILSKLRYRLGGETSEQQWNDLRGVVQVSGPQLDYNYLSEWAPRLNVADLLAALLGENQR